MKDIVWCRNEKCRFWVTPDDRFCPNCGIGYPVIPANIRNIQTSATFASFGVAALAGFLLFSWAGILYGTLFLGPVLAKLADWAFKKKYFGKRKPGESLAELYRRVTSRLEDLEKRSARVVDSVRELKSAAAEKNRDLIARLEKTKSLLDEQANHYLSKQREIEFRRLQNSLRPMIEPVSDEDPRRIDEKLKALKTMRGTWEKTVKAWESGYKGDEYPPGLQKWVKKLRNLIDNTDKIHAGLVERHAAASLKDVSRLEAASEDLFEDYKEISEGVDVPAVKLSIDQLEEEQLRLEAEKEIL